MKLSLTQSAKKTFMKLIVDKNTDIVLGAHMMGDDSGVKGAIAMKLDCN